MSILLIILIVIIILLKFSKNKIEEFSDFKRFLFSEAIFQRFTWIIFFVNKLGKIFTFRDIRIIIKYVAKIFLRAIKIYTKN